MYNDPYTTWDSDFVDHLSSKDSDHYFIPSILLLWINFIITKNHTAPTILIWRILFSKTHTRHFQYRFPSSTPNMKIFYTIKVIKSTDPTPFHRPSYISYSHYPTYLNYYRFHEGNYSYTHGNTLKFFHLSLSLTHLEKSCSLWIPNFCLCLATTKAPEHGWRKQTDMF